MDPEEAKQSEWLIPAGTRSSGELELFFSKRYNAVKLTETDLKFGFTKQILNSNRSGRIFFIKRVPSRNAGSISKLVLLNFQLEYCTQCVPG